MKVLRHYFISKDLDDLESFEEQLEDAGIATPQIHVFSLDDTNVENHHRLHDVTSLMKKDIIRFGEYGAAAGAAGAVAVLALAYFSGWTTNAAGWIPWIFLSIVILGFCTWEGGFIGIQKTNHHFKRFEQVLSEGKHVFFVDLTPDQESVLERLLAKHPGLELAGTEKGTPSWIIEGQKKIPHFLTETLP
ncbi:MAG: NAD/FAD-utilizing enzyme [Proteobacteria bacterium]|nr:NAD/FAD-utilizing enzyme [Pseudomonadota bacterium]